MLVMLESLVVFSYMCSHNITHLAATLIHLELQCSPVVTTVVVVMGVLENKATGTVVIGHRASKYRTWKCFLPFLDVVFFTFFVVKTEFFIFTDYVLSSVDCP